MSRSKDKKEQICEKLAKKMKNGSLSFLKPKAIPVPSTARDPGPVMIRASDHIHPTLASMASRHPSSSLSHVGEERGLPVPSLGIQPAITQKQSRLCS